jgi:ATP-dependent DNA ligase
MEDGVVKFFRRNSNNYTRIYGPKISQYIKDNVDAQACILDGQMVVWDNEKKQVGPFGLNQKVATRDSNDDQQICYMILTSCTSKRTVTTPRRST